MLSSVNNCVVHFEHEVVVAGANIHFPIVVHRCYVRLGCPIPTRETISGLRLSGGFTLIRLSPTFSHNREDFRNEDYAPGSTGCDTMYHTYPHVARHVARLREGSTAVYAFNEYNVQALKALILQLPQPRPCSLRGICIYELRTDALLCSLLFNNPDSSPLG